MILKLLVKNNTFKKVCLCMFFEVQIVKLSALDKGNQRIVVRVDFTCFTDKRWFTESAHEEYSNHGHTELCYVECTKSEES